MRSDNKANPLKTSPELCYPLTVLDAPSELVRGEEAAVLHTLLPRVERECVALNMAATERMDAAGIATLITLYCAAIEHGHHFRIIAPSHQVRTLLAVVGLDKLLIADQATAVSATADMAITDMATASLAAA